jgi:hypothetical protein
MDDCLKDQTSAATPAEPGGHDLYRSLVSGTEDAEEQNAGLRSQSRASSRLRDLVVKCRVI